VAFFSIDRSQCAKAVAAREMHVSRSKLNILTQSQVLFGSLRNLWNTRSNYVCVGRVEPNNFTLNIRNWHLYDPALGGKSVSAVAYHQTFGKIIGISEFPTN
jgi:hypothetical protein